MTSHKCSTHKAALVIDHKLPACNKPESNPYTTSCSQVAIMLLASLTNIGRFRTLRFGRGPIIDVTDGSGYKTIISRYYIQKTPTIAIWRHIHVTPESATFPGDIICIPTFIAITSRKTEVTLEMSM